MDNDSDVVATIKYRAWMSDRGSRVQVRLESLSDIVPRKGKGPTSCPSVSVYLGPCLDNGRESTLIYKVCRKALRVDIFSKAIWMLNQNIRREI